MRGLEFWFRSLATHLGVSPSSVSSSSSTIREGGGEIAPPQAAASLGGTYYSIIVVGTFLDHSSVKREEKSVRQKKIEGIAQECGLGSSSSLQYYEVSCSSSLENIGEVQDGMVTTMLSHSYMGERVPKSYLAVSEYLHGVNEERKKIEIPIMKVADLSRVYSEDLVKRALGLLSLWGECVYFESPPELSDIVILDPRFLAKGILADLFSSNQTVRLMKKDGVMKHADLQHIWKRFKRERE